MRSISRITLVRLTLFALLMSPAAVRFCSAVDAEIRTHNGRPTVFIDGNPMALPTYSPNALARRHFVEGTPPFFQHDMGAYFLSVPQAATKPHSWGDGQFWVGDEISSEPLINDVVNVPLDDQAAVIQEGAPNAYFMIRNGPSDAPLSWRKLHPDQLFVTETGERLELHSLASDLYWDMLARACTATVQYCEARPWSDRIIGYWFGMHNEGTYAASIQHYLFDHSDIMLQRWRQYLRDKYATDERLAEAHGVPDLTFETVRVPKDKLRGSYDDVAATLYWQDAAGNQPRRDYLELVAQLTHDGYRKLMRAMQTGTAGRKRILLYDAFKQTMLGWDNPAFFALEKSWKPYYPALMAGSGHMRVAQLFDAEGFSGAITPHDYQARGVGGVYEPEGIADSLVLRGKYFMSEMDTRAYAQKGNNRYGFSDTPEEFAAITWRNIATSLTRGFNSYWMDLYTTWFSEPELHAIIDRQVDVLNESLNWQHETVPGIAMIVDDTAVLETNGSGHYFNEAIMWETKMGLARCGVPYRIYLFEDLINPDFPSHRVYYFPNLFRVTDERLQILKEHIFRDGNVVLWGPGSGISDGASLSPMARRRGRQPEQAPQPSPERLTGFSFHPLIMANYPRRTLITNLEHPITQGLSADTIIGGPLPYGPLLFPVDGQSLGRAWTKQGMNLSGLAVKTFGKGALGEYQGQEELGAGDWASVFTTAVPIPAAMWRGLAKLGGAHVYSESNDVLLADKHVVALHSAVSGEKEIRLPSAGRVTNLITGELHAEKTDIIKFRLDGPETGVFFVE